MSIIAINNYRHELAKLKHYGGTANESSIYRGDKFTAIAAVIYQNRNRDELYRIEQRNPVVTAMKFMDKGRNDRIYCREIETDKGKLVILCELYMGKKSDENRKKEKNIIKKVAGYEFKIHS